MNTPSAASDGQSSVKIRAAQHDAAHQPQEMRQRHDLRDVLRRLRHAGEREHEARQQDLRQEREERHLHCLELRLRQRRDEDAERQVRGDEHERRDVELDQRAAHRHVEQHLAEQQHDRRLHEADPDERQDLAERQLPRRHRRGDQHLEVAALAFAHERDRREQHHRHREDHADEARHGVHGRAPLAGCRSSRPRRRRRSVVQPRSWYSGKRGELARRGLNHLLRAVDDDLHGGPVAPLEARLEIRRQHERGADLAGAQQLVDLLRARRDAADSTTPVAAIRATSSRERAVLA